MAVNSYTVVDIMKSTPTRIDLAPSFNGRVGDSQSFTKLWFKSNGLPLDLTNYTIYFEGKDSNGTAFKLVDFGKANQTGDNLQIGKVTFYMPAGTFQVSGDWDYDTTFFGIKDSEGTVISTVNVGIHVLENSVDFGIDSKPFYTDLEKLIAQMKSYITGQQSEIGKTITEVLDKNSNLNVNLKSLIALVENYQKLIENGAILTQADIKNFKLISELNTALKPTEYVAKYAGLVVNEKKTASTISVEGTGFGYLKTVATDNPSESSIQGSVIQTFKIGTSGTVLTYVRSNKNATDWNEWAQTTNW